MRLLTPNSIMRASIILPMTVMKSNVFHGSLKKFCKQNTQFKTMLSKKILN